MLYLKKPGKKIRKRHGRHPADDSRFPAGILPLAVLWAEPGNGTIISSNSALNDLAGYRGPDLRKRSLSQLFPEQVSENTGILPLVKRRPLSAACDGIHAVLVTRDGIRRFTRIYVNYPGQNRGSRRLVRLIVVDEGVVREEFERLQRTNTRLNLMGSILHHDLTNCLFVLRIHHGLMETNYEENPSCISSMLSRMADDMAAMERFLDFSREYTLTATGNAIWLNVEDCVSDACAGTCRLNADISGLEILGDGMIQEVFYTLFENAMRHGKTVSEIRVRYRHDNDGCTIITEDNGVGIAQEKKELVFARGYGDHTGYGLYFARLVLELNGMTIRETGTCGSGARFEIQVPRGAFRVVMPLNRNPGSGPFEGAPSVRPADR
jgi:signal transduction histidine kinase